MYSTKGSLDYLAMPRHASILGVLLLVREEEVELLAVNLDAAKG